MNRYGILQYASFFIYLIVQVMLLKNLVLFNTAFCFFYVAFILLLPVETGALILMIAGFFMGLAIDIFYDSIGVHAGALVFIGYIRNLWLNRVTPQGGYDGGDLPTLTTNGLQWFLVYAVPMVFVHHFILFFLEAGGFSLFGYTLLKIFMSTLFSVSVILMIQYLIPQGRRI
jgi:hypothetical protein